MRKYHVIVLLLLTVQIFAQVDELNILNRDSFAPFVKKVTMNCYLINAESKVEDPMSSRYLELDSTGAWRVQILTYSDGDESYDTVKYDQKSRTRVITRTSDFDPSRGTTVYNKDGTVKSYLSEPGQRDPQLTEYAYDDRKRLISMRITFVEHLTVEAYAYDAEDRLINLQRSSGTVGSDKLQLDYEERFTYEDKEGIESTIKLCFYYGANQQIRVRDTLVYTYGFGSKLSSLLEVRDNGAWEKFTIYLYDTHLRLISESCETKIYENGERSLSSKQYSYDSLGYYSAYIEEESTYGFSNRWTTTYNEKGLPVQSVYATVSESYLYEWIYEYRN